MSAERKKKEETPVDPAVQPAPPPPRLKERYHNEIAPALTRRFGYRHIMEVPRLSKIVVSMGVGVATQDPKLLDNAVEDLTIIAAQRPVITRHKRAIAQFKVRSMSR